MTRTPTLPKGWSVELLGLINAVRFTGPIAAELLWTDSKWYLTNGTTMVELHSLGYASTQIEARRIGSEFINKMEED